MAAPAKVSKNAREGRPAKRAKDRCAAGHEIVRVMYQKRGSFRWMCQTETGLLKEVC